MPRETAGVARAVLPRLARDLKPYRRSLAAYCGILVVSACGGVTVPLLTSRLVDHGLLGHDRAAVLAYGGAVMAAGLVRAVASSLGGAQGMILGTRMVVDLRARLYAHLQTLPLAFFTRAPAGAVQSRVTTEVDEARNLVQILFGVPAASSVTLVAAVVAMATINPLVTVVALAAAMPLFPLLRAAGDRVHARARAQAEANKDVTAHLAERLNVGGAMLRILFGHREQELATMRDRLGRSYDASVARNMTFARSSVVLGSFSAIGVGIAYLIGGWWATSGSLSVGSVVALAGLVGLAYSPITTLATSGINIGGGLVAFERVYDLLDFPARVADPEDPIHLPRPVSRVEVCAVSFRHPNPRQSVPASLLHEASSGDDSTATWALREISFSVVPGGTTAIVGATGAGKSTVAALICRLYDPTEGSVRLDGVDLRRVPQEQLHRVIGMVTQDTHLLNDTLSANLRLASPDATEAEMREVCQQAVLTDVIDRLPDGFDTLMGDRGYRLSGGERQRVALARVLLAGPDIVVLDEATAHLDNRTEEAITAALRVGLRSRTRIVIAHRLSTIVHADRILVMDQGRVVESGTHQTLLDTGTSYRNLYGTRSS